MKIFIVAGEASGDWMGAKLIKQLLKKNKKAKIQIIGGKKMEAACAGLRSHIPITELSLMGFAEILPHIPRLRRRMAEAVEAISEFKPDMLVTIDSPGFNFRIAKQLQFLRPQCKFVHYVAPTVWAYKPERAQTVAELYDKLLCILPFEPPYFEEVDLNTVYIGHPLVEDGLNKGDAKAFIERHGVKDFICLMPGSRKGELKRMLPVFEKVTEQMNAKFVIIAADYARFTLEAATKHWKNAPLIVDNAEKLDCFAASIAGIIKSGTAGLEYAFTGKPFVVAYKINPLSAYMLRRMIRINFANLVNILLNREVVPELLQEDCEADYITENLHSEMLAATAQKKHCADAIAMLHSSDGRLPSEIAADEVLG